jgi:hypothetical protein
VSQVFYFQHALRLFSEHGFRDNMISEIANRGGSSLDFPSAFHGAGVSESSRASVALDEEDQRGVVLILDGHPAHRSHREQIRIFD